jgi:hypothetical protein
MYIAEEVMDFDPPAPKQSKLDPAKAVDQAPPPAPAVDPVEAARIRLEKIRKKYDANCVAAAQTLGRALPEDFESSSEWDETSFINANAELQRILDAHNNEQTGAAE